MASSNVKVEVPAELFLTMARLYKQQGAEYCDGSEFLLVDTLERRAYRKIKEAKEKANGVQ